MWKERWTNLFNLQRMCRFHTDPWSPPRGKRVQFEVIAKTLLLVSCETSRSSTVCTKHTRLHAARISLLLFYKVASGGSAPTFVLESRCAEAAIILPGLTFGIKALKLEIVGLDVASATKICFATHELTVPSMHRMEKRGDAAGELLG